MAKEIRDQGVQALLDKEVYDWIHPVLRELQSRVVRIESSDGKCSSGVIIGTDLVLTTGHGVNESDYCIVSQGVQEYSGSVQNLTCDALHKLGILATNSDLAVVKVKKNFGTFQDDWSSVVAPQDKNPNVLIFLGFCGKTGVMRCSVASCITEPLQKVRNDLKVGSVLTWNSNATRGFVLSIAMLDYQNWVIEVELGGGGRRVFHSNDQGTLMVKGSTHVKPAGGVNLLSPVQHSDSHTLVGNKTSAGGSGGAYFTLSGELFGIHIGANGGSRLMVKPYNPCSNDEIERQVVPECRSIVKALHMLVTKNRPPPVLPTLPPVTPPHHVLFTPPRPAPTPPLSKDIRAQLNSISSFRMETQQALSQVTPAPLFGPANLFPKIAELVAAPTPRSSELPIPPPSLIGSSRAFSTSKSTRAEREDGLGVEPDLDGFSQLILDVKEQERSVDMQFAAEVSAVDSEIAQECREAVNKGLRLRYIKQLTEEVEGRIVPVVSKVKLAVKDNEYGDLQSKSLWFYKGDIYKFEGRSYEVLANNSVAWSPVNVFEDLIFCV